MIDAEGTSKLQPRQVKVIKRLLEHKSHAEIASELGIAPVTVRGYINEANHLLSVSGRGTSKSKRYEAYSNYLSALQKEGLLEEILSAEEDNYYEHPVDAISLENEIDLVWDTIDAISENQIILFRDGKRQADSQVTALQVSAIPIPQPSMYPNSYTSYRRFYTLLGIGLIMLLIITASTLTSVITFWWLTPVPPSIPLDIVASELILEAEPDQNLPIEDVAPLPYVSLCGETGPLDVAVNPEFQQDLGVIKFTRENSADAMPSNFARALVIDRRGLWAGFFPTSQASTSGLIFSNRKEWFSCNHTPGIADQSINDIAIDSQGVIWVASERAGVSRYDGISWQTFTTVDGLPSNETFAVTVAENGTIWVGTLEGVAAYANGSWTTPYSRATAQKTIADNNVHAIAFDSMRNTWIGHIDSGVSRYSGSTGRWTYYSKNSLGGNEVRDIIVRKATDLHPESVWFALADGGVSRYEADQWTTFSVADGLPSEHVLGLAIDRYHRIWAATASGVAYWDELEWKLYHTFPATSVAIGLNCDDCAITDDQIWTATFSHGLTYSRLPLDTIAVDILDVKYPKVVAPNEEFYPTVIVAPRSPYQLRQDRGDFLAHVDSDSFFRFQAHQHIASRGIVHAGEPFTFVDYNTPFVAPELEEGESEKTFSSTWRVWMHTRFVGEPVIITFTVRRPSHSGTSE
jgi:hypothetical protein